MPYFNLGLVFAKGNAAHSSYYRPLCGRESAKMAQNMRRKSHLYDSHCVKGILWAHSKQSVTVLGDFEEQ